MACCEISWVFQLPKKQVDEHLVIHRVVEVITMYKTIYDHAAEITQDVIKARGEAINGGKELTETYLSDEAVTNLR
jgi:hypothetical protein